VWPEVVFFGLLWPHLVVERGVVGPLYTASWCCSYVASHQGNAVEHRSTRPMFWKDVWWFVETPPNILVLQ